MFIVRIIVALLLIATFVLVAGYFFSRNKNYLIAIKRLYQYVAWFGVIVILLSVISRVIKL
ncbi:MAG: hypothetical protein KFB94_07085 [Methylophilaceae bacterium]|nr:MAG: hypothetical protein KFB94_07085 [Methylophilaceae bacterium]